MQYVKIKDSIVEQIEAGMLSPRQKLPAERKLAESFDTTRVTLREALSVLEAEGRIYREDRRGWFISPEPLRYDPTQTDFPNMAKAQNRVPKTELVAAKERWQINRQHACWTCSLSRTCTESTECDTLKMTCGLRNKLHSPELFPNLLDYDLSNSLTDIYRDYYGVTYQKIRYRISTCTLLGEMAQALRATAGTPAMVVERINYNQHGELIDCDIEYWRHDAISIESLAELNR